jgi:hypothetical protein
MINQLQLRRGTASEWVSANPILAAGEIGVETDTQRHKIGNGSTTWNALPYPPLPSNVVVNTIIDARGDLLVGTSDNVLNRFPVGANNQILIADSTQTPGMRWINSGEVPVFVIVDSNISRTLVLSDAGRLIRMNGNNSTLTVPADSTTNFNIGTQITVMQGATGPVQFAAASGVTVQVTPGLKLRTQFSVATLIKTASNVWLLFGDLVV